MTDRSGKRLEKRLHRILLMLPYAIQNPGVSVSELSERFGVKEEELLDDLNLVFMCGLPGYGPGDLIEVSLDDDLVHVRMADYFSAPLRLNPAEALSLYAGAAALAELPEMAEADALRRSLGKLGAALGINPDEGITGIDVRLEVGPQEHVAALQTALADSKRVHLQYLSASKGELSNRDVDPWGLVAAMGRWYLVGQDHLSGEERMFRIDRIKKVSVLGEAAEVPADFDPDRYRGAFVGDEGSPSMSLEISPEVSRWFTDYYPVRSSTVLSDGWQAVELEASGPRWAATLILQLGAGARKVSPPELAETARTLAEAITADHH
ncbi:MAG: WYL domain-containing protein [Actinobacteria bacterium]|nr:WYL domain-containing protein [Actinomycetota bacterium]